jgi:hypothetical protein
MARIGEMKCWNPRCSCADVAVHETSGKSLTAKCHKCSADLYGKPGTKARRDIEALYTPDADAAPAPAAPPKAGKASAPAPAPVAPVVKNKGSGLLIGA